MPDLLDPRLLTLQPKTSTRTPTLSRAILAAPRPDFRSLLAEPTPGTTDWESTSRAGIAPAEDAEVKTLVTAAEKADPVTMVPGTPTVMANSDIVKTDIQSLQRSSAAAAYGGGIISQGLAREAVATSPAVYDPKQLVAANKLATHEALVREAARQEEIKYGQKALFPLLTAKSAIARDAPSVVTVAAATASSNTDFMQGKRAHDYMERAREPGSAPPSPDPGGAAPVAPDIIGAGDAELFRRWAEEDRKRDALLRAQEQPSFLEKNKKLLTYAAVGVGLLLLLRR